MENATWLVGLAYTTYHHAICMLWFEFESLLRRLVCTILLQIQAYLL